MSKPTTREEVDGALWRLTHALVLLKWARENLAALDDADRETLPIEVKTIGAGGRMINLAPVALVAVTASIRQAVAAEVTEAEAEVRRHAEDLKQKASLYADQALELIGGAE
jgi:hypothetical protein